MVLRFGNCQLNTHTHVLQRGEHSMQLQPRVFQVLLYLLEHGGQIVSKQELSAQVWPGQRLNHAALENTMKSVRQAIGDDGRTQRYISTFRGVGYRFMADIQLEGTPSRDSTLPATEVLIEPVPLPTTNATILVVDDDPQVPHFFEALLSREGWRVLTAHNGYEALAKIATEHPQLVLLDVNMEYLDGFDVLDMIKKRRFDTQVILYSETYTADTIVESIKHGAVDFLTKPFPSRAELVTKIKKYLPHLEKNAEG